MVRTQDLINDTLNNISAYESIEASLDEKRKPELLKLITRLFVDIEVNQRTIEQKDQEIQHLKENLEAMTREAMRRNMQNQNLLRLIDNATEYFISHVSVNIDDKRKEARQLLEEELQDLMGTSMPTNPDDLETTIENIDLDEINDIDEEDE